MKKNYLLTLLLALLFAFMPQFTQAQAPKATPEEAITGLLNRIGGDGAADKFEIVIDASLAENGKDVFVITSQNGKPCIKGNTQLSVATGINWYLNHYAHINLTWNNLTTDLSQVTLPVPGSEEKHVSNAKYRYDFNTCTFSYSMAFWTWDRWQQEIDWMALHGVNAPLNLVGLDVVTRKFLRELGVNENDINAYIAGPGFIAWFAMNNLEGWGGTINAKDVTMNGNPDWWYTRQENLCRNMLQRMRELGMQPVIPGFSGQVPNCIVNYTIKGFSSGDVVNNGTWAGGYTRPDILKPNTESYRTFAAVYYKHLHEVMGVSELYSIDPFHEGSLPGGVTNETCYPNIMVELDNYYNGVSQDDKTKNNVDEQPKWIIQYWQGVPQSGAFSAMSSYGNRFIGLDLFSDAPGKAKWNTDYFQSRPYIFCMLHNFGGRSGMHGRLESTMNDYFRALAKGNNCQGIGATPEGTETNPILYDMLFELPWMSSKPNVDEWLADYAYARYGVQNDKALTALQNLKKSVWACPTDQQGTSEAVILARPNWTVNSVSSWSTAAIYWDTQDVLVAADELSQISDLITTADGTANYNYDFIDVVRQSMVDYAAQLLPLINAARNNDAEYTRLYQLYLQLMLDLDAMLSYDANFKLERWTSLARNIADEVSGTTENDRRWLEWNARTQVTVWSNGNTDLHDYSNRCWAGLIKDFHYKRWEKFFTTKGGSFSGGWFSGFEYPWTVDFTNYNYSTVTIPNDMTATAKAKQTFGNYFGRVKGEEKNYIFPMGITTHATKSDVVPEIYRGNTVALPLEIRKTVTINSVWIDLNNDGAASNNEKLEVVDGNKVTIPADATIGKTTAQVVYSDGTDITFNLALIEDISAERTVTAVAGANGSVAIEGANGLTVTNKDAVKMTATANAGYNFANWTDANSNVVSNDNPFIYYGKEEATFTANFIQDKWGVVACNGTFSGDIASYKQFIHNLNFAYYNREAETIFETTTAPTEIFNTIPKIVNVPQGASFTVSYDNGNADGLKYCYFRAFIDLNQDGDFDDEGELLKETGTNGAANTAVCSGSMNVVLPYDMPLGITHMRLRFDGAWDNGNKPSGRGAKDASIRPVYELILNVTEFSDKAATINVESNNNDWGTVKVWTDETPDGSTRTEWEVTKGVDFYIAATKASEDVEFLGWYDHYGRLLTTELQYSMLAREDATYTARFRKALEIDGWQFEYRTEPGSELNVKGALANGVKPEAGKTYYIYAPTNYNSVSATRYLYDNNGTLATNISAGSSSYVWTCIVNSDNTYSFQNASGKYLANNGSYHISIGDTPAKYYLEDPTTAGVALKNAADYSGGKYMVTKHDGSAFNRNGSKTNGEWCSDYVFTEVTYPDVVILTSVRQSGDHDLEIPETVEILGEQCKIVGFDNNLFKNNKDLWTISLPSTIEEMSNNKVFTGAVKGKGTNAENNSANYITTDLGTTLAAGEDWSILLTIEDNGNNFNQWGSALIATGNAPMNSTYGKGFQLYLQAGGGLVVKTDVDSDANKLTNLTKGTKFRIDIVYTHANTQLKVTATPLTSGKATSLTVTQDMSDFSVVSHAIPEGVNITNLEVRKGTEPDPFEGCNNLFDITIADGCKNYYIQDRALYRIGGVKLHQLAEQAKAEDIRALGELIDNTKALMDVISTSIDPIGKVTEIELSTTVEENYYIWCSNPHKSGDDGKGGVPALLDEDASTYLHTNWDANTKSKSHDYLQINNVNPEDLYNFKIAGQQRNGGSNDRPKNIEIYGSNDNSDWTLITTVEGLPNTAGATWSSGILTSDVKYSYLKFVVKTHDNYNQTSSVSRPYFHMAKFDLFKLTSLVEVAPVYKNLAGITNDEAANVYDNLVNALYVYNNGATTEELQAAYNALKPLYTALNAKKGKVLNGVYKLQARTYMDNSGSHDFAADVFVAYNTDDTDNPKSTGYKLIATGTYSASVETDKYFTITPNDNGYTLQAQGLYVKAPQNLSQWGHILCTDDVSVAGYYKFEDVGDNLYKLVNNQSGNNHLNVWESQKNIFGNENSKKFSTIAIEKVEAYTLTVPASGVTTLCLPFNVVLPEGITAYEVNLDKKKNYTGYALVAVASAGETLAKNTPVIIKATAADYTLTITMDEEGAKQATASNVLSSGLIKTTVAPANTKYAFDGENFNVITANTEVAANQCWMELSENCGSVIYGGTPAYLLTTDEANPILYKIIIKRAEDGSKVLQYDETSKMVAVANKTDNSSWQAWYFMGDANGITIHPYNADGMVLSADNTSNDPAKVWAAKKGEKSYYEWLLVPQSDGYYNIQAHDKSNYFSNNGGVDNKMGFWSKEANTDGGSLFKFVEVEFPNDNPRFYQLSDVKAILTDGKDIPAGTTVGLYSNVEPYREAYETASDLIGVGNTSASANCYDAYKALRNTKVAITYNEPDESKYYVIKSVANEDYCKGKFVRTSYEPAEHDGSGDTKYDHRHLVFDAAGAAVQAEANAIPQQSLAIFQFVKTGTIGEYKMKNLHTGLYVKNFAQDAEHMGTEADAQPVVISGYTDGAVTLTKKGDANPMHAQDTHDVIVTYGAEPGNASLWSVEEIAESEISYKASISNAGYSTLFLNYPVAIPDGVEAHTASGVEGEWLKMEKLDGIIPANTAVVLKGNAGEYDFILAGEADPVVEDIFTGTLYKQTITKEDGTSYYVLANTKDGVGFYNAVNGENTGQFINAANKAYLHITGTTQSKFYGFRFENGETTGINGVKDQSSENYTIYDLQGRKVNNPTKGLYIINGKKVYIK